MPKTVDIRIASTARRIESMQQSFATQSLHLAFWGLRKIVACSQSFSQCLLVSTVFGMVSSLHPTSFLQANSATQTTNIEQVNKMMSEVGERFYDGKNVWIAPLASATFTLVLS